MVGASTAMRLGELALAERIVLVDVRAGVAQAMALDIAQALPFAGSDTRVEGGDGYEATAGSDLVVITAGLPRAPGQSRADLLEANGRVVAAVAREVRDRSPTRRRHRGDQPARRDDRPRAARHGLPARARHGHGRAARHGSPPRLRRRAHRHAALAGRGADPRLARRHDGAGAAADDGRRPPAAGGAAGGRRRGAGRAHARRRRRDRAAAGARVGLVGAERRRGRDGARDPARRGPGAARVRAGARGRSASTAPTSACRRGSAAPA